MDSDKKTLAELSGEVKEKKYVTLDTGSKISGYTKDYLDRLCRLNKIEHRLWVKGGFVVELGSLLRETHTLLISDDEISFVHKRELVEQPGEGVTTPSPAQTLGKVSAGSLATQKLAVERPATEVVASVGSTPPKSQTGSTQNTGNVGTGSGEIRTEEQKGFSTPGNVGTGSMSSEAAIVEPTPPEPLYAPSVARLAPSSILPSFPQTTKISPPPPSQALPPDLDEWETLLFGGASGTSEALDLPQAVVPPQNSLYQTPSAYRPIQTSVDSSPHHDIAPLFPFSTEKATDKENTMRKLEAPFLRPPSSRATPQVSQSSNDRTVALSPLLADEPSETFPKVYAGEHHLSISQPHSLVKGVTLSALVALFIVSSAAIFFSMLFPDVTKTVFAGVPTFSALNTANVSFVLPQLGTISYESDHRAKSGE